HAVAGTVLLPGAAFVELAVRAGDEAGCGRLDELTLHEPLLLGPQEAVARQVGVRGGDDAGRRAGRVYSPPGGEPAAQTGVLRGPAPPAGPAPWTGAPGGG
ncbi:hypothetical protein VM98_39175, partial [Streptomyces rubellomurinus subsp. indigoferus]